MLGGVRIVPKESLAASKNEAEKRKGDSDDPEMLAKRKEAGLEWMSVAQKRPVAPKETSPKEPVVSEENPKELNPHLKNGGEGYPTESNSKPVEGLVGDGGASWFRKGLKRAHEQAAREGKNLPEVLEDRWGSYDTISAGMAGKRAAHANAHLHAIRDRKRRYESSRDEKDDDRKRQRNDERGSRTEDGEEDNERDRRSHRHQMKAPTMDNSFKWGKEKKTNAGGTKSVPPAFKNDGSFLQMFKEMEAKKSGSSERAQPKEDRSNVVEAHTGKQLRAENESVEAVDNLTAAKALKLRLMGKEKEADELLKQAVKSSSGASKDARRTGDEAVLKSVSAKQRHTDEHMDTDRVLASKIYRNKQRFGADDEYDDVGIETEKQKQRSARRSDARSKKAVVSQYNRIQTQNERCQFCFENPSRPKHLTIAIGNFTYLMLPPTGSLVPGHCYIVTSQHEGSTRNVDDDVWEEMRNFKKCLLKMFQEQEKDVLFMETVIGLSQQRRHCLVECIPVPRHVFKQAPLYFKTEIDEVESEWSQHNAKKLIDTRGKGLRGSIPKNFPYFHVEFGLEGGYCHIIDDETSFKSNFGRNVLIGMLKLPEEGMHQKSKQDSFAQQMHAVEEFSRQWKPHDWTKMLE